MRITDQKLTSRFEIDFLSEYTDDALLTEVRRVASLLEPGQRLTKVTYQMQEPRVSYSTIQNRFGGWTEALALAGLGERRSEPLSHKLTFQLAKAMSKAELLVELKRVHAIVGTPWLTREAFNQNSSIEAGTIRRRFGSFRGGLEAAGVPSHPLALRPMTDEECFQNLADVWIHLGHAPRYRDMFTSPSRTQGKTYVTRWGTWRKALQALVNWSNTDRLPQSLQLERSANTATQAPKARIRVEADARDVRPGLRFRVLKRDGFRCLSCGRSPATHLKVELHADHVLAVANGGKTVFENLQTLCRDCNLGKGKN